LSKTSASAAVKNPSISMISGARDTCLTEVKGCTGQLCQYAAKLLAGECDSVTELSPLKWKRAERNDLTCKPAKSRLSFPSEGGEQQLFSYEALLGSKL